MRTALLLAAVVAVASAMTPLHVSAQGKQKTTPTYYVLSLQKCNNSAPHSIHGLWPQFDSSNWPSWCDGPDYNQTLMWPLMNELYQYWPSCSDSGHSMEWFLNHEWAKHGTCSGWDQYTYFATAIATFKARQWESSCPRDWDSCKVHVTVNGTGPNPPSPPGPGPTTPSPAKSIYFVLATEKCTSDSDWSIHGLWPQWSANSWPSNCPGAAFDMELLNPLQPLIKKYMPTCQDSGHTQEWFLSHEWSKHGTCSGWDQYTYFATTIETFRAGKWRSSCTSSWSSCKTPVAVNGTGPAPPLYIRLQDKASPFALRRL